jgi:hypothetical protein
MTQADFRAAVLDPGLPVPIGLTDPQGRPAGKRFDVYRNNVAVGLTEALEAGFPVVRKLVGPDFFAAMAGLFLRQHPPASALMMHFGMDLPEFLTNFPPVTHLSYLPDVARIECALRASYHAADALPLLPARLGSLPPERLLAARLTLAPSLRILRSRFSVWSIWSANTHGTALPSYSRAEEFVVLRPEFDPEPHLLPPGAFDFLAALDRGETVATAIECAGDAHDLPKTIALLAKGGALTDLIEDTP